MSYHVGVTATRKGLTAIQLRHVAMLLAEFRMNNDYHGGVTLHQGCCIGGDEQITIAAATLRLSIIAHPPTALTYFSQIAFDLSAKQREPKDFLDRNKDIVDESAELIAAPDNFENTLKSGTWSTYRYAQRGLKKCTLVLPDGRIEPWFPNDHSEFY